MPTTFYKRQARPGGYDRSGQLMVELWADRDTPQPAEHRTQPAEHTSLLPNITLNCPECGAPPVDGRICRELYEELIRLEREDPDGAGSVHNLSVLCYVVQHPGDFSDATLNWGIDSLRELVEGAPKRVEPAPQARGIFRFFQRSIERSRRSTDRSRRSENRSRRSNERSRPNLPHRWRMTIDQVYRPEPDGHPERVQRWARAILGDIGQ